ncbi:hypothetical protein HORIV_59310 [Vreelandella olivaria]|uniref:TRAP C4-dicarboxylate transport system permease DctM subunit domain-containing protein n=1 Tax=Vreelandella olivaria TaxID=390919 RepID=A0ABN5X9B0_9GAMM|nr:hypothetical protein HORIV_59310 [Halomonas olivaria]
MDISTATILMVGAIFALLVTGLPLAFITGLVAMAFTFGWFGEAALPLVTSRVYGFITEYSLVAVPMFVLMASLLDRSGIAKDLFNAMRVFAGRLPGGVAVQTIVVAFFPGRPFGHYRRGDRPAGDSGAAADAPPGL